MFAALGCREVPITQKGGFAVKKRTRIAILCLVVLFVAAAVWGSGQQQTPAPQSSSEKQMQGFDWKRYEGQSIQFLANNNPVGQLLKKYSDEFAQLTGINVTVSLFSEQQFRQRLQTIFQAKSNEVDVFMSLVSREGMLYEKAGWYADINKFVHDPNLTSPDYNFSDFGKGVIGSKTVNGKLTGIPVNIEGPILYYRADILNELGLEPPKNITDLEALARTIKQKRPDMIPYASRGLAPALPYTFSNFLHNFGGEYTDANGKSNLSSPEGVKAIELYAKLLRDYGPDGVINYSYPQLTAVNSNGQAALTFESSNEFNKVMQNEARTKDTKVMVLPPGPGGNVPVVIGWELCVSPYSDKQNLAWYFVQWATSQEMQIKLGLEGLAPPRTSVWDSSKYQDWLSQYDVRRQWADALSTLSSNGSSILAPQIVLQPEARQVIGQAVGSVVLGQATAEQAAKDADQKINELIAKSPR
jgi:multiple sugar transport system substrate-binding protein